MDYYPADYMQEAFDILSGSERGLRDLTNMPVTEASSTTKSTITNHVPKISESSRECFCKLLLTKEDELQAIGATRISQKPRFVSVGGDRYDIDPARLTGNNFPQT